MGFFSWITSDTDESISNVYSERGPLPVYLLCPNGEKLYEPEYEGYGIFAGKDAYALLAQWNFPEKCNGEVEHDRLIGIYARHENIRYPLKFVKDKVWSYEDVDESEEDPKQGFFYDEDEEDDDDEYWFK